MKQTAVEFLHSEDKRIFGDVLVKPSQAIEMADALEKAKEMFEQQVIDAYNNCIKDRYNNALVDMGFKEKSEKCYNTGKEYYNETFKKK